MTRVSRRRRSLASCRRRLGGIAREDAASARRDVLASACRSRSFPTATRRGETPPACNERETRRRRVAHAGERGSSAPRSPVPGKSRLRNTSRFALAVAPGHAASRKTAAVAKGHTTSR
ncbi:hypothetical protein MTO96_006666 [Rhipicephalus appendiculatus]